MNKFLILFFLTLSPHLASADQVDFNFANSDKIDAFVKTQISKNSNADVIVYLDQVADLSKARDISDRVSRIRFVYESLKHVAAQSQAEALKTLESSGYVYKSYYIENAILVKDADPVILQKLANIKNVERVTINAKASLKLPEVQKNLEPAQSNEGLLGHITRINAHKVWNDLGVKGKGIVVAGQDTGYYWQHNAIRNQYRGNSLLQVNHDYNWHDAFNVFKEPTDDDTHGTHTMGSVLGYDGGKNKIGVAPEAEWIGCRNMKYGTGSAASYMECFEFFLAPYPIGGDAKTDGKPEMAPHIINNSWGCPASEGCKGDELLQTIKALNAAGIMTVVSAGNSGPGCGSIDDLPAHYAGDVLSVGAYNRYQQNIAGFSSRGPSRFNGGQAPVVVAYGETILSSIPGGPDRYDEKAGTSMSAPQVAGVVALLWSARPELIGQIETTMDIIQRSAQPLKSTQTCGGISGSNIPNPVFGYGMVDAFKAITTY